MHHENTKALEDHLLFHRKLTVLRPPIFLPALLTLTAALADDAAPPPLPLKVAPGPELTAPPPAPVVVAKAPPP